MNDNDWDEFLDEMTETYEVEAPERLRRFLKTESAELEQKTLKLEDGFLRGTFSPYFSSSTLLSLYELGEESRIDELDMVDWPEDYPDFLPLAGFWYSDPYDPPKAFLIVQVSDPECPVWVWDYSFMLFPLAASLDDFVAGKAWDGKEPLEHHHASSQKYKAFSWE